MASSQATPPRALYRFQDAHGQPQTVCAEHIVLIKPGENGGTLIFTLQRDQAKNVYHVPASLAEVARVLGEISANQAQGHHQA